LSEAFCVIAYIFWAWEPFSFSMYGKYLGSYMWNAANSIAF